MDEAFLSVRKIKPAPSRHGSTLDLIRFLSSRDTVDKIILNIVSVKEPRDLFCKSDCSSEDLFHRFVSRVQGTGASKQVGAGMIAL